MFQRRLANEKQPEKRFEEMQKQSFYLKQDGRIVGPLTIPRISAIKRSGALGQHVWISADKTSWKPAGELEWFRTLPDAEGISSATPQLSEAAPPDAPAIASQSAEVPVPEKPPEGLDDPPCPDPPARDFQKQSPARIIGDSLMLCWNTTDKLLPLGTSGNRTLHLAILTTFTASFLLCLIGFPPALAAAGRNAVQSVAFGFALWFCPAFLLFSALWGFRILFGTNFRDGSLKCDLLLTGTLLWIFSIANLSTGASWRFLVSPPSKPIGAAALLLNLFVWSFALSNAATALRIGLCRFSGFRPRNAVWQAGALLGANLALLYFLIRTGEQCQ